MRTKKIKFSVPGMFVHHGSYHLRWRPNGQRTDKTLGRVDEITKEEAETKALEFRNGQRSLGLAGNNSGNMTFLGIFQDLCETSGKVRWKPSTFAQNRSLVHGVLQEFHNKPIAEISKQEIRHWYYSDKNLKRPTRTDNAYRVLHRVMQYSISLDLIEVNPCQLTELDRFPKKKKQTKLNYENSDLGKFLFQLGFGIPKQRKKTYQTTRDLVLLFLLTGARKTALSALRWEHVDFENLWFLIPPEHNKKRKGDGSFHQVPMARIVQRMLRRRYENRNALCNDLGGDSPVTYVFPDRFGKTHVKDARATIRGLCEAAGITVVGPHDLRRTVASFLPEITDDYVLRQQYLSHSVSDVHVAHYAGNQSLIRRRKFAQDVADYLSCSIFAEGADGILRGRIELAPDNRTEIDERWADENTLEWVLYGDEEEKEAAIEKFVWAADGNAITKMMEQQGIGEDFDVVEGGYAGETN
jgi:integrase